ncbi:MAG: lipoyl domain-containing protein, partial [Chlamydiia bacterium]|nr:lipoyl domain-containing protein [Chlamydiia bacterium]
MTLHPITIDAAGGEYMDSVLVIGWHKAPGDAVAAGDLLLTVETAKAATDI